MYKGPLFYIAIVLAALALAACGGGGEEEEEPIPPGFPVAVERADGQPLTFDSPPTNIVSLSPGHTEILFALEVGDRIVAVDTEADFPQEVEGKPKLDAEDPDIEAIADLKPDLVVIMAGPEELIQALDARGLQVLRLDLPESIEDLFDQIDTLGLITGRIDQADTLIEDMDERVLTVLDRVGATDGPRLYHELDELLTSANSETFIDELYVILNADNIAADFPERFPQLTPETIIEADPQVIILAYDGATPASIGQRPGWADISAVKQNQVFAVDPDLVNRPGPRLVDGLERLAQLLHPDIFP